MITIPANQACESFCQTPQSGSDLLRLVRLRPDWLPVARIFVWNHWAKMVHMAQICLHVHVLVLIRSEWQSQVLAWRRWARMAELALTDPFGQNESN